MKRNQDKISLWKRKKRYTNAELLAMLYDKLPKQPPVNPEQLAMMQQYYQPQPVRLGWFSAIVGALR